MLKLMRRRLLKRNSGGFTLAEVIISCALLGILILGVIMFVTPILDSVTSANASTKASNVAESIEYYISRSLRNAAGVVILTDTTFDDVLHHSNEIDKLMEQAEADPAYTLKCISIRLVEDYKSGKDKYFICNENVESSGILTAHNLKNDTSIMVFDPCYFDGLYPKIDFLAVPRIDDNDDNPANKVVNDDSDPAIEIKVNIYDDPDLSKNGGAGYRGLVFSGTGYTALRNIELALDSENTVDKMLKIVSLRPDDESKWDTSKDTYIFYVERTLAVTATP